MKMALYVKRTRVLPRDQANNMMFCHSMSYSNAHRSPNNQTSIRPAHPLAFSIPPTILSIIPYSINPYSARADFLDFLDSCLGASTAFPSHVKTCNLKFPFACESYQAASSCTLLRGLRSFVSSLVGEAFESEGSAESVEVVALSEMSDGAVTGDDGSS